MISLPVLAVLGLNIKWSLAVKRFSVDAGFGYELEAEVMLPIFVC